MSPPLRRSFLIVGVGASAGGLETFIEMFRNLPPNTGMAFVLVQHLSPQHASMLSTFVQKATQMKVQEVEDGTKVAPNHVYIIPPNAMIEIFHGVLHLSAMPEPHATNMPVNVFLNSLARDQGNLAVGVILSGTGSDGANGLRDIKSDGGITLVQEPMTAKFDGMPRAAISVAAPDHILPIDAISRELVKIASHPVVKLALPTEDLAPTPEIEQILQKLFILVRAATKIDFSTYKYPTIMRRIKRRMVLHRIDTLKHYLDYLQVTPLEVHALFEDLLINVTSFFRDAEAFDSLKIRAFPEIAKNRPQGTPIRVWVPGCSTGEEVYSIAISLLEFLGDSAPKFPIQIYGTDICESAIKIARTGFYPETAAKNVSAARLERFFLREQGGFRVSRVVRDCCIFSLQDVTSHPPINRLDLLSCRNLMIYLGPQIQKKLMETFFYALNPRGFLMLGSSETVGTANSLFAIADKKYKIYTKKSTPMPLRPVSTQVAQSKKLFAASALTNEIAVSHLVKPTDPVAEAERRVLDQYAPAWVLVNQNLDIVQFRGPTGHYIEPASGQPSWNLMKMLRPGLSPDIRVLIHSALKTGTPARKNGLKIKSNGFIRTVDIEASAIAKSANSAMEPHCLVLFIERETSNQDKVTKSGRRKLTSFDSKTREINNIRAELETTQKSLQIIIDDQNAVHEEMQTANEEVLSANEELQSTNEELETAKEELQSTNEELTTLNDELTNRNNELAHLSNDLVNVLDNVNVSIVMVGPDLRIRRFTSMAEKLLKLVSSDVDRSLADFNLGFQTENLADKIHEVVRTMSTLEIETRDRNGVWYSIRIRPYKTTDNKIDGAVLVFINIDDVKNKERTAQAALQYSNGIIETVRDPLVVLDQKLHIERANQAFYDTFNVKKEDTIGRTFYELGNRQWDIPQLRTLLEDVLPRKKEVRNFEVVHHFETIGKKAITLNARALEWEGQIKLLILIALHDVTE